MKMKKSISLLVILCVATAMLTACGKFSEERTRSVSFPKTVHITSQGTETITNYSHDRVIVHDDGYIEVRGTMETDGEESSVQWLYAPDGMPIGSREGDTNYVFLFDNYFDFVPGEDGVLKVDGNTVYYEDYYEVYDVENGIIREINGFSNDGQPGSHFKMNEFGQLLEMAFYASNGEDYISACKAQMDEANALEKIRFKREKAEVALAKDMAKIQALVRENAYISQDQQVYRQRFEEMSEQIEKQKNTIAELQEQELRLVGVREKLYRFIEALESFDTEPTFDSVTWNALVERVLVNPKSLIFEFKNGEKIKITI